jgi:iron complex outermembrane receptor protein
VHSSFLQLDGYREHGAGRRGTVYGKLQYRIDDATDLSVILNGVDTPVADDPGGLTRHEADDDPRQANPLHTQLDAGEDVQQGRAGVVARHRMAAGELSAYTYLLYRDFQNRLPIPPARPAVQGGIVAFHRFSPGGGVRYLLAAPLLGWPQQLTLGIDAQHQDDERRRFQNAYGQRGALGLHQHEQVTSAGPYLREAISLRDDLEVNAGARYDTVHFAVDVDTPPDSSSSGSRTLEHWSPAGGVRYAARPWLSLFADAGTAFQVPGTTEFANPAGAGFNPDLGPQTATSYELGARAQLDRLYAGMAAFYIDIRDELVPYELASQPGRTFFRNAGHSRRYGLEIDWQAALLPELRWTSAVTLIRAEYVDYATPQGRFDGNHEPGIPPWQIYQELAYRHRSGLFAAFEVFAVDHYAVDDANAAFSRSYVLCNLRAGYDRRLGNWTLAPFVGLDNLTGAAYDGRVRTNAVGGRFFEPGPGFNVYGGLAVTARM